MCSKGRLINEKELELIDENYPNYLLSIIEEIKVIGKEFSLDEEQDESEFGVEMQWMTVEEQLEEAYNVYPGILALPIGYYPIGKCLEGSGDVYFISKKDKEPKVFRIPHDAILNDEINESEIDFICNLKTLLDIHKIDFI